MALRSFMRASNEVEDGLAPFVALKPDTFPEPNAFLGDGDTGALCVENVGLCPNLGGGVSARFWSANRGAPAAPERPVHVGVPMSICRRWRLDSFNAAAARSAIRVASRVKSKREMDTLPVCY